MARMEARYIALLGRLIAKYGVMQDLLDFSIEDKETLRLAKTEYDFYHAHERIEAGTTPDQNLAKEYKAQPAGSREKLSLKTTR